MSNKFKETDIANRKNIKIHREIKSSTFSI